MGELKSIMKKRRIINFAIVWMLIVSFTVPAYASETEIIENPAILEEEIENSGQESLETDAMDEQPEMEEAVSEEELALQEGAEDKELPEVSYRVHVQSYGWQDWKNNGEAAGTVGQSKRLEAIELSISHPDYEGGVTYCTHVQSYGWQDWKSSGEMSGTSGQAKRLEAIQIKLTGELAEQFDIYYRVHAQSYSWLGWAKNGECAGTSAYAKRLEAIEIQIVGKDRPAPGDIENHYCAPKLVYKTHVQSYGWQGDRFDGEMSGTSGTSKRLEGITIRLHEPEYSGGISYRTHVQSYGWQDWRSDGQMSGTAGQAKRLEAIQIELTGEISNYYDVYYRVHCQTKGWMSWACNGKSAGTEGFAKRLEAIEIKLVKKDDPNKPDISGQSYVRKYLDSEITFFGYAGGVGDITAPSNGEVLGTTGQRMRLEGMGINLDQSSGEVWDGAIQYRAHCQSYGWTGWVNQGEYAGTKEEEKRMEAIQIRLTGEMSNYYDIYYRVHVQSFGWLGWTKNGGEAGTSGISYRIEAVQIRLAAKNEKGPAMDGISYRTVVNVPAQSGLGLETFGSYKMSDQVRNRLNGAIDNFTGSGSRVGFYMIDLNTGKGVCYNSNSAFYCASAIKGPYVISLNEKVPLSANHSGGMMHSAIKVSDNYAYDYLRSIYGSAPFSDWCNEAGCTGVVTNRYYIDITARQLAQMWTKGYEFFYSGRPNSIFCRELFINTLNSPISSTMSGRYTVYSKAGWIGNGGNQHVQNDGGIVMRSGHPYAVVILSTAYGRLDYMNLLVSAIDAAHEELLTND
ncbi:MAG: N-acetylmuramoyl-L-alanine amidase [Dorea sp.]|nr:N-acetylmuramoyl-L-alanine amidase [Dorea sp.]